MAASPLVRTRVRSFEAYVLRHAYHQSYVGGDNAIINRFAWHVYNDEKWPTFAGPGSKQAYLAYLPDDPVWLRDAFEVAFAARNANLNGVNDDAGR